MSSYISEAEVIESLTDCGVPIENYFVNDDGFLFWEPEQGSIRFCMEDDDELSDACRAFLAKGWDYKTADEVDAHARRFGWENWPGPSAVDFLPES